MISVTPSGQRCGAAVIGVDLASKLDPSTAEAIHNAWLRHHVLVSQTRIWTIRRLKHSLNPYARSVPIPSSPPSIARNASPRSVGAQTKRARSSRKSGTPTGISWKHRLQAFASIASPFRQAAAIPCFSMSKKPSKKCPRRYEQDYKRKQRFTRRAALSRPMEIMRWTNTKAVWTSDRPKRLWLYLATRS